MMPLKGTISKRYAAQRFRCLSLLQYWFDENQDVILHESRKGGKGLQILEEFKNKLDLEQPKWSNSFSVRNSSIEKLPPLKSLLVFPKLIFEGSCTLE
jgi:hypothetical protein